MDPKISYQQALDYVFGYNDYEKLPMPHAMSNYDLRRVMELLERLDNPQEKTRSVHIGGTNGKGSTAAMIASVLITSGYRTGLYTSPHLHTIRERFRVNGEPISETDFTDIVAGLMPEVAEVNRQARYGELTTFELLTALAFCHFSRMGADFQVLEVGMGGRFDATNVITPEVSIITSISLDHTRVLGNSVAEIAGEKAGIIKPGGTVILGCQPDSVIQIIEETCRKQEARLYHLETDITYEEHGTGGSQQSLTVTGRLGSYSLSIPLLGKHQLENAACAVAALEVLKEKGFGITAENITQGLASVKWAGRLQVLSQNPLLVVDGAHNPDAAAKLKRSLMEYFSFKRAILIIGVSSDKDIDGIARELKPLFDEVIVTRSQHPRAMATNQLRDTFREYGTDTQVTENITDALAIALKIAEPQDIICVAGSLFIVAEATAETERLALPGNDSPQA